MIYWGKSYSGKKPRIFSTFCYCNNTPIDISTDALDTALTTCQALFYALCIPTYLIPTKNLGGKHYYYPYALDEETEAQWSSVIFPYSQSYQVAALVFGLGQFDSRIHALRDYTKLSLNLYHYRKQLQALSTNKTTVTTIGQICVCVSVCMYF